MSKITYKLRQLNEDWKVFGDRVIRMNVDYEIKLNVPAWFNQSWMEYNLDSFKNLEYKHLETDGIDDGTTNYVYEIRISSISKCDLTRDKFDETTGIYICETRAELKVLAKIKKVINSMYEVVNNLGISQIETDNLIDQRIEKNAWNLERLKGTYEENEN